MIPAMKLAHVAVGATVLLWLGMTPTGLAQSATPWTLVEHTVATDLRGAYDVVVADMNHDGKQDLLAVAGGTQSLIWFENPSWTRHVIATGIQGLINAAAFDIDKDGIPEIAASSGFATEPAKSAGVLTLYTHAADPNAPWTAKEFDRTPASHRIRWIEPEGNGKGILINAPLAGVKATAPDYKDQNAVYFYDPSDWKRQTVTDAEDGVMHGLFVTDWDGKKRESLLTASMIGVFLHRYEKGKWIRTRLVPGSPDAWPQGGAGDVTTVNTKAGRMLAALEPFHGNTAPYPDGSLVVYTGKGEKWGDRMVLDNALNYAHTLVAADLDGDGNDELIAGSRGKPNGVYVYRIGADKKWTKTVLENNAMAGSGCRAADFNGDKRIDLACTGGTMLKWYENQAAK
jgi:hypothetical protein